MSLRTWARIGACTTAAALLLWACDDDSSDAGGGLLGALVDEEVRDVDAQAGGNVPLASGANATFPAGALSQNATIRNAEYEAGSDVSEEAVSNVYLVTNETPVGLDGTYQITVPYDGGRLEEGSFLRLRHQPYVVSEDGARTPEGGVTEVEGFSDDRENFVVNANVQSFGAYWVALVAEPGQDIEPAADAGGEAIAPDAAAELPPMGDEFRDEQVVENRRPRDAVNRGNFATDSGFTVGFHMADLVGEGDIILSEWTPGESAGADLASNVFFVGTSVPMSLEGTISVTFPFDGGGIDQMFPVQIRYQPYVWPEGGEAMVIEGVNTVLEDPQLDFETQRATAPAVAGFGVFYLVNPR